MKKTNNNTLSALTALLLFVTLNSFAQTHDVSINIRLHGAHQSKISLMPLTGENAFKPIIVSEVINNNQTTLLKVPAEYLPGEFVLRFDYKAQAASSPYPAEKKVIINQQELNLVANPPYINNPDSSYFQPGELENSALAAFNRDNEIAKAPLTVLQSVLLNYDDTRSEFYQSALTAYENRRTKYHNWLAAAISKDKALFVSHIYQFNYLPRLSAPQANLAYDVKKLIDQYFEMHNLNDPLILRTAQFSKWVDGYVNLYGQLINNNASRDSLLSLAARTAIERAKKGNSLIYGWMVDYFYKGFETNQIQAGMKVLEPYINDPECPTRNRQEINKRLQGIEKLVNGATAPEIKMIDIENKKFELTTYKTNSKYMLLLFWAAGCSHCNELVKQLNPWYQQKAVQLKVKLVGVSLDDNEYDTALWRALAPQLGSWMHLHAAEGVRSQVANDYSILSTPTMFLLDAQTKKIVAQPTSFEDLKTVLQGI